MQHIAVQPCARPGTAHRHTPHIQQACSQTSVTEVQAAPVSVETHSSNERLCLLLLLSSMQQCPDCTPAGQETCVTCPTLSSQATSSPHDSSKTPTAQDRRLALGAAPHRASQLNTSAAKPAHTGDSLKLRLSPVASGF